MISIIVPVYNAQKYLNECVDSILNQTYKDFELLLVDDGSTDNSPSICDEYAKNDNRVRVIHKSNGGASSARNLGLDESKGAYVIFIDSDDYISQNMLELLFNAITQNNAQMAVCGATVINTNGSFEVIKSRVNSFTVCDKQNAAQIIIQELNNALWNKIIKKSAIADNKLELGKTFGEDYDFLVRILDNCDAVCFIPDSLYYYRKNDTSVTASKFSEKRFDQVYYRDKVHNFVCKNFASLSAHTNVHRFTARLNVCRHIYLSKNQKHYKDVLRQYKLFLKQEFKSVKAFLSKKEMLEYSVFCMGGLVYSAFVNVLFKR